MDSITGVLVWILHSFQEHLIRRTPNSWRASNEKKCTKECKLCVLSYRYYIRATQFIFVKISLGTTSSLTVDCKNQISKQPKWLWWQNKLCIGGKKLRLIWSAVCFKGKESNPIRVIQWNLLTFRCELVWLDSRQFAHDMQRKT